MVLTLRVTPAVRSCNQASLSATLNLGDFIVRSCISAIKTSKIAFATLDLQAVHFIKAIFRGTLKIFYLPRNGGMEKNKKNVFRSFKNIEAFQKFLWHIFCFCL